MANMHVPPGGRGPPSEISVLAIPNIGNEYASSGYTRPNGRRDKGQLLSSELTAFLKHTGVNGDVNGVDPEKNMHLAKDRQKFASLHQGSHVKEMVSYFCRSYFFE